MSLRDDLLEIGVTYNGAPPQETIMAGARIALEAAIDSATHDTWCPSGYVTIVDLRALLAEVSK